MNTGFVSRMWPHAQRVSERTGLDPRLVVAQSALETGWGRAAPGNNYFGIKSHGEPGGQTFRTHEIINGQRVNIDDSFRAYDGMGQSADGYASFLETNPRYRGLLSADGLDQQIAELQRSGYATDPNYGQKVRSIASRIDPAQIEGQSIANDAMRAVGREPEQQSTTNGGNMPSNQQPSQSGMAPRPAPATGLLADDEEDDRRWFQNPGIWEALAMGFNSMRHQPDDSLPRVIQANRQRRSEQSQQAEAEVAQREQMEQALGWLQANNAPAEIMQGVAQGVIPAQEAVAMTLDQMRGPEMTTGFQTLHQRAEAAGFEPGSPEYQQMMTEGSAPQTNINVNTGRQDDMWGQPESGNVWLRDPEGNVVTEPSEDGRGVRPVQVPISGGQVERDIASSEREGQARAGTRGRVGGTAVDEMNLLLDGLGYDAETGQFGESRIAGPRERVVIGSGEDQGFLSRLAYGGTESIDWMNTLQSLQDTIAIDRLLEIKEAGSGLGQVPQSQLHALARAMGNLDPSSSDKLIGQNLLRARSIYEDVVRQSLEDRDDPTFRGLMEEIVPEARVFLQPTGGQQQPGGGQASAPAGEQPPEILSSEDRELWSYMSEEDRQRVLREYEMNQ